MNDDASNAAATRDGTGRVALVTGAAQGIGRGVADLLFERGWTVHGTVHSARKLEATRERLGEGRTGFTASMVGGDGKLYATSEEGAIHVVKAGPTFEVLAVNDMGETCMATPAISAGRILSSDRKTLIGAYRDSMNGYTYFE